MKIFSHGFAFFFPSAGKATYGRYYTKNQIEKTTQLLTSMQKEELTRLETVISTLAASLNFGDYKITIHPDGKGKFYGSMYFFNISREEPAYVANGLATPEQAKRLILEQTASGLESIFNQNRQNTLRQLQEQTLQNNLASNPFDLNFDLSQLGNLAGVDYSTSPNILDPLTPAITLQPIRQTTSLHNPVPTSLPGTPNLPIINLTPTLPTGTAPETALHKNMPHTPLTEPSSYNTSNDSPHNNANTGHQATLNNNSNNTIMHNNNNNTSTHAVTNAVFNFNPLATGQANTSNFYSGMSYVDGHNFANLQTS